MMKLRIYNTMTHSLDEFVPLRPGKVGIYVCGVTVWDSTHLGHGRAAVTFDLLVRYLRSCEYEVTYVRNFTDVDDKIIQRAIQEGCGWSDIAQRYIAEYRADMEALGNIKPDVEPQASEHIQQMISLIEKLIAAKKAYVVGHDVFYAVRSFADYGKLSGKKIEELAVGARVEANQDKRDPLDFALWKGAKPGEPHWPSPWGDGRPGWHIECSAMSTEYLGQPFDIHGGGCDLIFPHHENEIAQSEGAGNKKLANYWMHNGSLTIDQEKMSKSLGNFFKSSEALANYDREVLRFFLLSSHYRSPLDFSEDALADAGKALTRYYDTMERIGEGSGEEVEQSGGAENNPEVLLPDNLVAEEIELVDKVRDLMDQVNCALADDLNTPRAFGAIFELIRAINRYLDTPGEAAEQIRAWMVGEMREIRGRLNSLFGIFGSFPAEWRERMRKRELERIGLAPDDVLRLVTRREKARRLKDYAESDRIREQLRIKGVILKDKQDGSTEWWIAASK